MICYEIWVNGERVCLAGAERIRGIQAMLILPDQGKSAHFFVNAETEPSETLMETFSWINREITVNDELKIKLVQSETPDHPSSIKSFGTKTEETGKKKIFCSFCGQSQDKAEKIVAGHQANVCSECFKLLGEIFNEQA